MLRMLAVFFLVALITIPAAASQADTPKIEVRVNDVNPFWVSFLIPDECIDEAGRAILVGLSSIVKTRIAPDQGCDVGENPGGIEELGVIDEVGSLDVRVEQASLAFAVTVLTFIDSHSLCEIVYIKNF